MSPGQARGWPVDKRADVWAFGCVLYEMLAGRAAFHGDTLSDTLVSILQREPEWDALAETTPSGIRRLLRRCLEKDHVRRLRDMGDARLDVEEALAAPTAVQTVAPPASLNRWSMRSAWVVAAATIAIVALLGIVATSRPATEIPLTRLSVLTSPTADPVSFAISPDGRQLVFVAMTDSGPKLWLRPLAETPAQPLAGTDGAIYPFWAPDSRALGFFADGKLKRIDLGGGSPRILADAPYGRGGTWSREGVIVFAPSTTGPLMRVAASSDKSDNTGIPVTELEQTRHQSHRWPQFLPDGQGLLFFATNGPEASGMYLGSLRGGVPKRVLATDSAAEYAPPGYLLVSDGGGLLAHRVDLARAEVADSALVAQPVGQETTCFAEPSPCRRRVCWRIGQVLRGGANSCGWIGTACGRAPWGNPMTMRSSIRHSRPMASAWPSSALWTATRTSGR